MELVVVGLNHKTAPLEIREKVAFPQDHIPSAILSLRDEFGLREAMIISTCNRVEVYGTGTDSGHSTVERIKEFLYKHHSLDYPALERHLYSYQDTDLIRHVFRVASSLDSMVQGEPQILGQMKQAFACSEKVGVAGDVLARLLPRAFFVAKRVRSETRIASSPVSISSVAVELARKIFGDLEEKTILLLGAGKMSELAARNLLNAGANSLKIANRTGEKAEAMALSFGATAVPYSGLEQELVTSDIVLVSTGSESYVLEQVLLDRVIRRRKYRPLFLIDISVPRNVAPEVNDIENIFLFDIDDLKSVISANLGERQREAELAEEIVRQEVENFESGRAVRDLGPLVNSLREKIEEICLNELKSHRNGFSPGDYERVEKMMRRVARRIAHPLMIQIKRPEASPDSREYSLEMIRKAFGLDDQR